MARNSSARLVAVTIAIGVALLPLSLLAASGRAIYDQGAKLFESGDFEGAAKKFAEAYKAEPDPAYVFSEASAYRRLGKAELAALRYEKYLKVLPAGEREEMRDKARGYASEMRLAIGLEFQAKGDCSAGMVHMRTATEHEKGNGAAWLALGECAEATGDRGLAETAYAAAVRVLSPGDALSRKASAKLEALRSSSTATPATDAATSVKPDPVEKKKAKKGTTLGIVIGIVGGVVLVGAGVTVGVLLATGGSSLDFPNTDLGVMEWDTGR